MDAAEFRARFPVLERIAYLNAGSDGPLPGPAVDAGCRALAAEGADGRALPHVEARKAGAEALRAVYAERLGCAAHEVALTTSTSEGLAKVLLGLGLGPGDEVLTSEREHPGLLGPLVHAQARGVRVRTGPLATLADHVTRSTTLVLCSHVGWMSGEVADPRLADAGVPVVFDGAQGVGAVAMDVRALGCLAYAGSGQKWLCGADGTGMLYIREEDLHRVAAVAPAYVAFADAAAAVPAAGADPSAVLEGALHPDARRHDTPALAREAVAVSLAAAGVLADFGWDAVLERGPALAGALATGLAERGLGVGPRARTTLVAWEVDDPRATARRLAAGGIVIRSLPESSYVRASVGAWNDETDLERLLEAL